MGTPHYTLLPSHIATGPHVSPFAKAPDADCRTEDVHVPCKAPGASAAPFAVQPTKEHAEASMGAGPRKHTTYPYVTGNSVLAFKYAGGVLMACDMLGAYGSTKRYKSVTRIVKVNDSTIVGASGEISDFQYIKTLLDDLTTQDFCYDDGHSLTPREVHGYLCRVLYNRRNKMDPLWNSLVVAGIEPSSKERFVGCVGMIGTSYEDSHVATSFGNYLSRPLFREFQRDDMSLEDAIKLMQDALRVLFYRDKTSINKFILSKVDATGVSLSEPFALDTTWDLEAFANPSKHAVGSW